MILEIERLGPNIPTPTKGTKFSACYDLSFYPSGYDARHRSYEVHGYNCRNEAQTLIIFDETLTIPPNFRAMIPTGLKFKIPAGNHVKVFSRSSMALKRGLVVVNSVGIIDEDYNDPLYVLLMNVSDKHIDLKIGERIGQFECVRSTDLIFWDGQNGFSDGASNTTRGGGLGSTGT